MFLLYFLSLHFPSNFSGTKNSNGSDFVYFVLFRLLGIVYFLWSTVLLILVDGCYAKNK